MLPPPSSWPSTTRSYCLLFAFSGSVDRKSTRLNSSHSQISYAVFCLKKKTRYEKSTHHHKDIVVGRGAKRFTHFLVSKASRHRRVIRPPVRHGLRTPYTASHSLTSRS